MPPGFFPVRGWWTSLRVHAHNVLVVDRVSDSEAKRLWGELPVILTQKDIHRTFMSPR